MPPPTIRTPEIINEILRRLAAGETLRAICRDNEHLPHRDTVNEWLLKDDALSDQIAHARGIGSHALIDENREIADDGRNDWMEKHGESLGYMLNGEAVSRSKLRIDQRWREAEALLPKVYGKRQTVEHAGGITHTLINATDDEVVDEIAQLLMTGRLKLPGGVQLIEGEVITPAADDDPEDDYSDIA